MFAMSTLGDLREGYSELWSVLPSWAVRVWRFHRHLKKNTHFFYVNMPFGLSVWRRGAFKLFFEWQLLSYCIICKNSFDRFNKWIAYDTLLKSLIKHNAVKTIFCLRTFPDAFWWIFPLHTPWPISYELSLCVVSVSQILMIALNATFSRLWNDVPSEPSI